MLADFELEVSNSNFAENLQTDESPGHHKETHGRRDDIDENTSLDEVRAPNVFERVKEEIEALVETIHPKKESQMYERKFLFTY